MKLYHSKRSVCGSINKKERKGQEWNGTTNKILSFVKRKCTKECNTARNPLANLGAYIFFFSAASIKAFFEQLRVSSIRPVHSTTSAVLRIVRSRTSGCFLPLSFSFFFHFFPTRVCWFPLSTPLRLIGVFSRILNDDLMKRAQSSAAGRRKTATKATRKKPKK